MFDKIRKLPFVEIVLLIVVNFLTIITSVLIPLIFLFLGVKDNNGNVVIEGYYAFILAIFCGIVVPLISYVLCFYLSNNACFLKMFIALKQSCIMKIVICLFLFIITPVTLLFSTYFNNFNLFLIEDICFVLLLYLISLAFPLTLFFIFEPVITKCINKHCEKLPNSKTLLKKNYDLRMKI